MAFRQVCLIFARRNKSKIMGIKKETAIVAVITAMALLALAGCGKTKEEKDETAPSAGIGEERVYALPDYHCHDSARVGSSLYTYDIVRHASDSLPMVEDELGASADNTIRLTLTRNGREYCCLTLTKAMFRHSMDEAFYGRSILDGIRFASAEAGKGLTFSVSVSEPDSDMSIPFALTVADDGSVSFVKEEIMDVEPPDGQMPS